MVILCKSGVLLPPLTIGLLKCKLLSFTVRLSQLPVAMLDLKPDTDYESYKTQIELQPSVRAV